MKTDRVLQELAAKAAGLELWTDEYDNLLLPDPMRRWNPLTDDGDAFRLAVKLRLSVFVWDEGDQASAAKTLPNGEEPDPSGKEWHAAFAHDNGDLAAATRRAITRAAEAIQEAKEGV